MNNSNKREDKNNLKNRLSNLEKEYEEISKKVIDLSNRPKEEALNDTNETEEQIRRLRKEILLIAQERDVLLEQVASLEEQQTMSIEVEQERNNLQEIVNDLDKEKNNLLISIEQLTEERKTFIEKINELENLRHTFRTEKERQDLEQLVSQLKYENNNLIKEIESLRGTKISYEGKIKNLEGQAKALFILDKKGETYRYQLEAFKKENDYLKKKLLEFRNKHENFVDRINGLEKTTKSRMDKQQTIELDDIKKENLYLKQKIEEFQNKHERFVKRIKEFEERSYQEENLRQRNEDLSNKISRYNTERNELLKKIAILDKEKTELQQKRKIQEPITSDRMSNLQRGIQELEKERQHLFKIIGKLEEEKKIVPYLNKKTAMLEEELIQSIREKKDLKKQISGLEKIRKEMSEQISILEKKRETRFALEQNNGILARKVKELELKLKDLQQIKNDSEKSKPPVETPENKIEQMNGETSRVELEKNKVMQQAEAFITERTELLHKINKLESQKYGQEQKIKNLEDNIEKLIRKINKISEQGQSAYLLDAEKLSELKEFTLEAIQARRWKSAEFVNGAYDAIGLFYRTILSERPIKKNNK